MSYKGPNVLVLGAQKAGTSSLHFYLSQHPLISTSIKKELHYFDNEDNYNKGFEWYKKQFLIKENSKIILETTPRYIYLKRVAKRVQELKSDIKFIVILREPIARSFSAWNMYRKLVQLDSFVNIKRDTSQFGLNRVYSSFIKDGFPSYENAIKMELDWIDNDVTVEEPSLVKRGFYAEQIEFWLQIFPKENFLFLENIQLELPLLSETLVKIQRFMGLTDNFDWTKINLFRKHAGNYSQVSTIDNEISIETKERLIYKFSQANKNLPSLTGLDLDLN